MEDQDKNKKFGGFEAGGAGVKFQEGYRIERSEYPETSKIIQWVMKYSGGLVKDAKQANYVLLGFVAVAITVSLILVFGKGGKETIAPENFINKPQFLPK